MGRRGNAVAAAEQASEAARVLQARGQEAKQESKAPEPEAPKTEYQNDAVAKLPRGNVHQQKIREQMRESRGEPKEPKEEPKEEVKQEEKAEAEPEKKDPEPAAPEKTAAETAPIAAETAPEPAAPKTVKAKVDGEEFDVPEAEVEAAGGLKAYQIQRAAENRYKKSQELLENAQKESASVRAQQELIAKLVQNQAPQQPTVTDDQFIKSKINSIRFGTDDEASAAFIEAASRMYKQIDPAQLVQVAMLGTQKQQAVASFKASFPEIVSNPILMEAALAMEAKETARMQAGQIPTDFQKMYTEIGNKIRGAIPLRQNQPVDQPEANGNTSQVADKEARKASIVEPPKASARAAAKEEPKPETREESLKRMKKARGLPVD